MVPDHPVRPIDKKTIRYLVKDLSEISSGTRHQEQLMTLSYALIVRLTTLMFVSAVVCAPVAAMATPAGNVGQSAATTSNIPAPAKGEAEFLVAPGGSAFEVPVHAGAVCILSFPGEKLESSALTSSVDFEIMPWGDERSPDRDRVAVRAMRKAAPATIALATKSGQIKINLTLRVVPDSENALILVRFRAVTAEEAFQAKLEAELTKRVAPLQAELEAAKKTVDAEIRARADQLIAERLLKRNELTSLRAAERNNDSVIGRVERAILLGEDGYLFFTIQNRSDTPFRLAEVRVLTDGKAVNGPASLLSSAVTKDPSVVGVVAPGSTARGVVVVRSADAVLTKSLTVELAGPKGRGTIRLSRGITLR
jgi:hypothetical protein